MTTPPEVVARLEALALLHIGLWLQPARGALGLGRPAPVGDHHPEDPQR